MRPEQASRSAAPRLVPLRGFGVRRNGGSQSRPLGRVSFWIPAVCVSLTVLSVAIWGPTALAYLLSVGVFTFAWVVLMPRDWYSSASRGTRIVLAWFLFVRLLAPAGYALVLDNASLLFGSGTDADFYDSSARRIMVQLDAGEPVSPQPAIPGTGAVQWLLALLYWMSAPGRGPAMVLWAGLASIGMLLFWYHTRDLVTRWPTGYAAAVLLLPSVVFWTGGLGKEALVMFGIGASVAGYRFLTGGGGTPVRGLFCLAVGIGTLGLVRPHVALLLLASYLLGVLLSAAHVIGRNGRARWTGALIIAALVLLVLQLTSQLLGVSSGESVVDAAQRRAEIVADQGGRSDFVTAPLAGVMDLPRAVVTVLFRPFVWEASTLLQLLTAVEALALLVLTIQSLGQLVIGRLRLSRAPMPIASASFVIFFCAAVVSYGNFGLIARQRIQVVPFLLCFLFSLVPPAIEERKARQSARDPSRTRGVALGSQ